VRRHRFLLPSGIHSLLDTVGGCQSRAILSVGYRNDGSYKCGGIPMDPPITAAARALAAGDALCARSGSRCLTTRLPSRFEASRWRSLAISFERRLSCEVRRAPSVRKRRRPARDASSPRPRSHSSRATWAGLRRRPTQRARRSKRTANA
jgi:hypothetical protein